ncbi:MAG: hypothetical protein JRL30_28245 [Deltaproteobacteria bacterium]|nr:hypothetical protein [Deltaproteobacteria bacterium]
MEIVKVTRERAIAAMIENDICNGVGGYLKDWLRYGFKGYENYSDSELEEEYTQDILFEEDECKIIKSEGR